MPTPAKSLCFFGSLPQVMLSLYMNVTGGLDWVQIYLLVGRCGSMYKLFFIFFTFLSTFAVFNILTGVFVEKAVAASAPLQEEMVLEHRRQHAVDTATFTELCQHFDEDRTGTITLDEFYERMKDDRMLFYMAAIGLEIRDVALCC